MLVLLLVCLLGLLGLLVGLELLAELRLPVLLSLLLVVPIPSVLLGLPVSFGGGIVVVGLLQIVLRVEKFVGDSGVLSFQEEVGGVVFQSLQCLLAMSVF